MVTLRPRDSKIDARDAAAMPLPKEETTPPVTNMYLVMLVRTSLNPLFYLNNSAPSILDRHKKT